LITVIGDLFRDHETSGWAKAAWVFFLIFLPFLGVLIYLIARGEGMRDRTVNEQADARKQMNAATSPATGARRRRPRLHRRPRRGDLKELGEALDEGQAAVIVVGESKIEEQIEKATKRARKMIEKQIDAEAEELKRELEEASK
jgi:Phospholipase_D-nuclease N-terminal